MTQTPGQRTASTVLDLIDGAIGGDTSPDAMRWSPEPEPVADLQTSMAAVNRLAARYRGWLEPLPTVRAVMEAREDALILAQFSDDHTITRVTEV